MSVSARALHHPPAANAEPALSMPLRPLLAGVSLSALLRSGAERRSNDVLLHPAGDAPSLDWAATAHAVNWISRMLLTVTREQPATILLPMALDHRAMIAVLACLQSGMTPMLTRPDLDAEAMTLKADRIGATLAIGASPDGELSTLSTMRDMAARSFGMRCVAGFGATVPEGVVPLDRLMRDMAGIGDLPAWTQAAGGNGSLFVDCNPPALLNESDILAAAFDIARELRVQPQSRIVTAMTGGSLAALASGLGLALLAGAELVPLGVFALTRLWNSFSGGRPVHLVMPAEAEDAMHASGLLSHRGLASIIFVHRSAIVPREVWPGTRCPVCDIGLLNETRLAIVRRG
jgi:hypothetical protein